MADAIAMVEAPAVLPPGYAARGGATSEPALVRWLLIGTAAGFLGLFLFVPLAVVFSTAFEQGAAAYFRSFSDPDTISAIRLTAIAAGISVPLNVAFGIAAAWVIAKFEFVGKNLLVTLIDLPFSVSPVVAGLVFVLLFGLQGLLGSVADRARSSDHLRGPGIVLVTIFVTFPFVARELLPTMQARATTKRKRR